MSALTAKSSSGLLLSASAGRLLEAMSSDFVGFTIVSKVRRGDLEGVRSWLHHRGDVNFVVHPRTKFTLLMFAVHASARLPGAADVAALLLASGADANATTHELEPRDAFFETGRSALHYAALDRNVRAVDLLLAYGAAVDRTTFQKGWTPLAAVCASRPGRQLLWADDDDDARAADVAERLFEAGATSSPDARGSSPLHRAVLRGNFALVKRLVCNLDVRELDALDADGCTALMLALPDDVRTSRLLRAAGAAEHVVAPERRPKPRLW
ncbi:hypothetical protein SO694_00018012 [Aureococcus anophagefferens]|uniref:Uncharacterized protein n=1 Tax=Aureococcus anophagefferens TaxID=44056 RepID=A0ABR1G0H8_AURAN|nr:hypothetical protein JL722_8098 [Aureococcus anophagefferens]KAH8071969.1 hypothetical protein JL721_3875 [Aureococcus anophagefferens]